MLDNINDQKRAEQVLTATQMREADRIAIAEYQIPGMELMERAGEAAFQEILELLEENPAPVLVLCGAGNNGGDGYVIARKLLAQNRLVKVYALADPQRLKGDARTAYERFLAADGELAHSGGPGAIDKLDQDLGACSVVVDAILGTGLDRPVQDELLGIIEQVNGSGRKVLAVDIPSGVGGNDGKVYGAAIRARRTVTFQAAKTGCVTLPGSRYCGDLVVADIGIPAVVLEKVATL